MAHASALPVTLFASLVQVESLTIRPERPLVVMSMTRPRRSFGLPCKLVDRDAYDWLTDDYMAKVKIVHASERSRVTPRIPS